MRREIIMKKSERGEGEGSFGLKKNRLLEIWSDL